MTYYVCSPNVAEFTPFVCRTVSVQSMGGCNRCQMINLHQNAGQVIKSKEPLATLASYRREKVSRLPVERASNCVFRHVIFMLFICFQGKILFGVLLNYEDGLSREEETVTERWLQVGQEVHASTE